MNQVKVQDNQFKSVIIFFCFFFTLISSCQKKDKTNIINEENTMEVSKVKEILKKQIEDGASEEYGSFDSYNIEDLNALESLENAILKSNGFTFLTNKEFLEKIDLIFKRKIDPNSSSEFLKIDSNNKCDKKLEFKPKSADNQFIYVSKKSKFITDFWAIPELINYKKDYPDLANLENKAIHVKDEVEGSQIEIKRWKSLPNLERDRQKNIQIFVNRNKYLFNNNKASFVWLKFNDKKFLESLIKTFGYVQDKDLLKWVLENNRFKTQSGDSNGDEYGQLLWNKTCDGKFVFHKEAIEMMNLEMKPSFGNYMDDLLNYVHYLEEEKSLKFEEKMIIVANILHLSSTLAQDKVYDRFEYAMGSYYKFSDSKKKVSIDEEFKKNNYYGLLNFKTFWENAKQEGDGTSYPGQE